MRDAKGNSLPCFDPRERELQQYSGCFDDYDPMSAQELADLSREAGRELTEPEAYAFIRRRTHDSAVNEMLKETK